MFSLSSSSRNVNEGATDGDTHATVQNTGAAPKNNKLATPEKTDHPPRAKMNVHANNTNIVATVGAWWRLQRGNAIGYK